MAEYFNVKLPDAVFSWTAQAMNSKSVDLSRIAFAVCYGADSRHGIVLGASDKCKKLSITNSEPLSSALLKCADLAVEELDFEMLSDKAEEFFAICSEFAQVKRVFFDECVIKCGDDFSRGELESALKALGTPFVITECGENAFDNLIVGAEADSFQNALIFASAKASAVLKFLSLEAAEFELTLEKDGEVLSSQRTLAVATDSEDMLYMTLQSLADFMEFEGTERLSVEMKKLKRAHRPDAPSDDRKQTVRDRFRKMTFNDYNKQQKKFASVIEEYRLDDFNNLCLFIHDNPLGLDLYGLCAVAEKCNNKRLGRGDYYSVGAYARATVGEVPDFTQDSLSFLVKDFSMFSILFSLIEKFEDRTKELMFLGADSATRLLLSLLKQHSVFNNYTFSYSGDVGEKRFDLYLCEEYGEEYNADFTLLVSQKRLLNEPIFKDTRNSISAHSVRSIIDFEKCGVMGKSHQYCALIIDNNASPSDTRVVQNGGEDILVQKQEYIFDAALPYWIIYRNEHFDKLNGILKFGVFDIFCDSQIKPRDVTPHGDVRLLKLKEITDSGVCDVSDKSQFVSSAAIEKYTVAKYKNADNLYVAPRTNEVFRIVKKPKQSVTNGSLAILIPKCNITISDAQLEFLRSGEFREFYDIALNRQVVSIANDYGALDFIGIKE